MRRVPPTPDLVTKTSPIIDATGDSNTLQSRDAHIMMIYLGISTELMAEREGFGPGGTVRRTFYRIVIPSL
jgi:hypothetical protein